LTSYDLGGTLVRQPDVIRIEQVNDLVPRPSQTRTRPGQTKSEVTFGVTSLHFLGCGSSIILGMIALERLFDSQASYGENKSTIWSLGQVKLELGPVKQKVRSLLEYPHDTF